MASASFDRAASRLSCCKHMEPTAMLPRCSTNQQALSSTRVHRRRVHVVCASAPHNGTSSGTDSQYRAVTVQELRPQPAEPARPQGEVLAPSTRFIAETLLPTRQGKFRVRGYKHSIDGGLTFTEPTAIISGVVEGQENVPIRVHDACFTSEVLGSLKCDCAEQLSLALQMIYDKPPGMVIYLQQEGRGIGLANKIAAYSLQERGLDTVDANRALGLPDDCREYTSVRNIIADLGIKSVQLITNNPRKIKELTSLGINITGRLPCVVQETNAHNAGYLQTKRDRMDHLLDGSFCHWDHGGEPTQPIPTSAAKGGLGLPNDLQVDSEGRVVVDYHVAEAISTYSGAGNGSTAGTSNGTAAAHAASSNGISNGAAAAHTSNGNGVHANASNGNGVHA